MVKVFSIIEFPNPLLFALPKTDKSIGFLVESTDKVRFKVSKDKSLVARIVSSG